MPQWIAVQDAAASSPGAPASRGYEAHFPSANCKYKNNHLSKPQTERFIYLLQRDLKTFNLNEEIANMSKKNAWMTRWFYNKCQFDAAWCN